MTPRQHHPVLVAHRSAMTLQERVAEAITDFAGTMVFAYIHIVWFGTWLVLNSPVFNINFDPFPYGLLTLIVSLEAILLSTFIMIGQNRQGRFAAAKADHDYQAQVLELQKNTELTESVHGLVTEIHKRGRS